MATEDDVHMTERMLREIHPMPFQIAMKSQLEEPKRPEVVRFEDFFGRFVFVIAK